MDVHQQMDMIRLTAEFNEFAAPDSKNLRKGFPQVSEKFLMQAGPAVFGDENNMQPKAVNRMRA